MKQYFYALAMFSGTIIGVGLFGLPYVTAKAGLLTMLFYFLLLGTVILITHLALGEVCLRTKESRRLPGYAEVYLGKTAKSIAALSNSIGLIGSNLAYIIVGGGFLYNLLNPIFGGPDLAYILVFFASGTFITYLGSKTIAKSELFSLILFFVILMFLLIKSFDKISYQNFPIFDYHHAFLPYGVILFSLSGMSVIPEVREILGKNGKMLKNIIIIGTIIPIITYLTFIFLVLGVTGAGTTEDALTGLKMALGENIVVAGFLFGIITTFTSYLTISLTLKKIFWYDLKFSHFNSWVIACFIPIGLYLAGLKDFIAIVSFTGAVTMGIDVIMTYLIYLKSKKKSRINPEYKINIPKMVVYLLMSLFLIGVGFELISLY